MAIIEELHKNDYGTVIKVLVKNLDSSGNAAVDDVSSFTTKQIILKKPDGTKLTKTASFTTDGTDGYIEYTVVDGDLDSVGDWELQVYLATVSAQWYSETNTFKVYDNL
jgi:hypothetical protein